MGNWFDDRAKSAARRIAVQRKTVALPTDEQPALTRRDILKRGGVVAGVAWTAPVLMSVMTPAAAVSLCADGRPRCPDTTAGVCCGTGFFCVQTAAATFTCVAAGGRGTPCGIAGSPPTCTAPVQCPALGGICGGSLAFCGNNSHCAYPGTCLLAACV